MTTLTDLHDQLKWKTRTLDLILEIDQLRDQSANEREMLTAMTTAMTSAVEAELGMLWVTDEDSAGELQLRALVDRERVYDSASAPALRTLAQTAMEQGEPHALSTDFQVASKPLHFCLTTPLRVGEEHLGALLLLNTDRAFNGGETELVQKAATQIDSALQQARLVRDLQRRTRELELIARIDQIRDEGAEMQAMLNAVLGEICRNIEAETGFVMLYDRTGEELQLNATAEDGLFLADDAAHIIRETAQEAITTTRLISRTTASQAVRAIAALPLILRDKVIGVLGVVNRKGRAAFTRSDEQFLRAIASQLDTAIFENLQTQRLRDAFGQSVGPRVMERLLTTHDRDLLSGERRLVTTLFSDIRGFTHMSEQLHADLLQAVMNDHLSAMTDLVLKHEGTLDKYIGDCVMCFFNAPEDQTDHALRTVRLALEMQAAHHRVIAQWAGRVAVPGIGIGISTGETMVGNFGSVRRLEYTVLGHDVNLAARLCGVADFDQTLVSHATYQLVKDFVMAEPMPVMTLKGIEGEVMSWNVKALK
ncbi:MAG: GAF domain-containing protein [Anaerolineales bacterium]|nr:GAF domain-containing protein [Anaerolineales bacterium]